MNKILIVTPCVPGGLPTQTSVIAGRLNPAGVRIHLISKARTRVGRLIDVLVRSLWLIPQCRVVLVDVFGEKAFVYESFAILYASLWKRRLVVTLRNGMLPDFINRWPRWTRFVLAKPHTVLAPHAFLQQRLARAAIRIDGVIPNFIDLEKYTYRRRSSLKPRFLYLRGLDPVYNPEMAIRAFALVQRHFSDASLTKVGREGSDSVRIRALVRELGLRNVRFAGLIAKSEIPRLADEHDIHLHTNRFENMPVSIIEMWACGLPIVGTNVGGMPYLVKDGVDAILVPSEDHAAMAEACLKLLAEPILVERLSLSGRRRSEGLTWAHVKPMWERTLFAALRSSQLRPTMSREGAKRNHQTG